MKTTHDDIMPSLFSLLFILRQTQKIGRILYRTSVHFLFDLKEYDTNFIIFFSLFFRPFFLYCNAGLRMYVCLLPFGTTQCTHIALIFLFPAHFLPFPKATTVAAKCFKKCATSLLSSRGCIYTPSLLVQKDVRHQQARSNDKRKIFLIAICLF